MVLVFILESDPNMKHTKSLYVLAYVLMPLLDVQRHVDYECYEFAAYSSWSFQYEHNTSRHQTRHVCLWTHYLGHVLFQKVYRIKKTPHINPILCTRSTETQCEI